jgi:hypothetical protein
MIHENLTTVQGAIRGARIAAMEQIKTAAERNDYAQIERLNETAKRLGGMEQEIQEVHARLGCCPEGRKRRFEVPITGGALRHMYLVVTPGVEANYITPDQPLTIVLPDGQQFETRVMTPQNRLQERGKVRAFYEAAQIQAGDVVVFEEVSPHAWDISKKAKEN